MFLANAKHDPTKSSVSIYIVNYLLILDVEIKSTSIMCARQVLFDKST